MYVPDHARAKVSKGSKLQSAPSDANGVKMMMGEHERLSARRLVPAGPRRRASRRKSFVLPTQDSELSQRRRQQERLRRFTSRGNQLLTWRWFVGIASCIEFIIYVLPRTSLEKVEEQDEVPEMPWWNFFQHDKEEEESLSMESAVVSFETLPLTILYSLYFLDAFVQAYLAKEKTRIANEKERLLHGGERRCWNPSVVCVFTLLFYLSILPTWFWWEVLSFLGIHLVITSSLIELSVIERPYYSLGYAITVHAYKNLSTAIQETIEEQGIILERTIKRRLARFFIFHPRKFIRRYRKVQLAIIWMKYLMPIGAHVMNSNFLGVIVDVLKTWRQGANERYQQLMRHSLWNLLDEDALRELAATIIQRNYRSYRSRKWVRLVRKQVEKREEDIINLVQQAIKKRARQELEEQEMALNDLEILHEEIEANRILNNSKMRRTFTFERALNLLTVKPSQLDNEEDIRRQYELEQEIQRKMQREKQKLMLIRPDSRFVFRYQLLYVVCALIETAYLVLQPRLEGNGHDASNGVPSWTTNALRFFFRHAHGFVNVILCGGILIKFFVGDLDPLTGRLVPRSFFSRWIYPGLSLHLVVNPALSEISSAVKILVTFLLRAGPGRVWRWWTLFLLPVWKRLLAWLEWKIWFKLVQKENQDLTKTIHGPTRRRSLSVYYE